MYNFKLYSRLHADTPRLDAFRRAMTAIIKPGDTVLELGAGPGIFAIMAAKAGAGTVYAVDPSGSVDLLRKAAVLNGVDARVEVHQCMSTEWTPAARIDVVLHDIKGILPISKGSLRSLMDLRSRVAPAATLISRTERVYGALVSCRGLRAEFIDAWSRCDERLDVTPYHDLAVNLPYRAALAKDMIASDVHLLHTLDYRNIPGTDVLMATSWPIAARSEVDGVALWFESELADGITYTSGPDNPSSVYGQCYFPMVQPLTLGPGDVIEWSVNAIDAGQDYAWHWTTCARLGSGERLQMEQGDRRAARQAV
jgi:type I protein arginine methyltransferase